MGTGIFVLVRAKSTFLVLFIIGAVLFSKAGFGQEIVVDDDIRCFEGLMPDLAQDPAIISAVKRHNTKAGNAEKLDRQWSKLSDSDPFVQFLLNHSAANLMRSRIERNFHRGKGILIGGNGGLVAMTDKVSVYWQGEKHHFLKAVNLSSGELYVQKNVVDSDTRRIFVQVSTPVYDPQSNEAIGVLVMDVDQFLMDFERPCLKRKTQSHARPMRQAIQVDP